MQNSKNKVNISDQEIELIGNYLKQRKGKKTKQQTGLSIVFDLTYHCNLKCYGCAVNARYSEQNPIQEKSMESSKEEVFKILEKIKQCLDNYPKYREVFFLDFGGGEPLLRNDFFEIVKKASELFGSECVGFDTNATICDLDLMERVGPLVNYIGISIDGLKNYHNWWRDPDNSTSNKDCFNTTIANLKELIKVKSLIEKIEVTSVATKGNLNQIPEVMQLISSLGVKKFSIHRAMQVGRMADKVQLIPNAQDYLKLTISTLQTNSKLNLDFHIHHSLESIYSSIFLGEETYISGRIWCKIGRSSIGIDPWGTVYFCSWCVVDPWSKLSPGNLLQDNVDLDWILHSKEGIIELAKEFSSPHVRCYPCMKKCGGGCPIASAAAFISQNPTIKMSNINEQHLIWGISTVDPACPKFNQYL